LVFSFSSVLFLFFLSIFVFFVCLQLILKLCIVWGT
jgi:hypothetical protein